MSLPLEMRERALGVWGGRITLRVKTAGRGAPLVYLHPASGLQFDPFLASLSTRVQHLRTGSPRHERW